MSKYTAISLIVDRDFDKWNVDHGGTWWRPKKVLISKHAVLGIRYWKDQDSLNKEILGEDYAKEAEESNE